jgi:hypothetical protein
MGKMFKIQVFGDVCKIAFYRVAGYSAGSVFVLQHFISAQNLRGLAVPELLG